MNKHYTPEIEEFHKGFEFEFRSRERNGMMSYIHNKFIYYDKWEKKIFREHMTVEAYLKEYSEPPSTIHDVGQYIRDGAARVKHLDREDIKSLGFEQSGLSSDIYILNRKVDIGNRGIMRGIGINFREGSTHILLFFFEEDKIPAGTNLFVGALKNKSELINQLKRCGI